jgi:hypothetical protein
MKPYILVTPFHAQPNSSQLLLIALLLLKRSIISKIRERFLCHKPLLCRVSPDLHIIRRPIMIHRPGLMNLYRPINEHFRANNLFPTFQSNGIP